ncbi:MAG: Lrp/AsnC family transcriptional regulator [Rhodobacteraceae bacterium]|nr:Lrp/AsnC family transcriptional regulator [Paracoccaceae bacterium]
MDKTDLSLIALLRQNSRDPIANLAAKLSVSRATVRARLEKLMASGAITGFTIRLREDDLHQPVRGITLIKISGHRTKRIVAALQKITAIQEIHSTNGKWDLIAELASGTLADFNLALNAMREIDGILESETNLLLATLPRH